MEINAWDDPAERFRKAWSDPLYTVQERSAVIANFYRENVIGLLSDGYSWLASKQVHIKLNIVQGDGQSITYGALPIGSVFLYMQEQKIKARLNDDSPTEKAIMEKEMAVYRHLLMCARSVLEPDGREAKLLGRMAEEYNPEQQDSADGNPMMAKMMGSAGGIFDMIVSATEGNNDIPPAIKQTLAALKEKMAGGMQAGPDGMMAMLQQTFNSGELGGMFAEMKQQSGDNPMLSGMVDLMASNASPEEKATKITELTSDPAIIDEFKKSMLS